MTSLDRQARLRAAYRSPRSIGRAPVPPEATRTIRPPYRPQHAAAHPVPDANDRSERPVGVHARGGQLPVWPLFVAAAIVAATLVGLLVLS